MKEIKRDYHDQRKMKEGFYDTEAQESVLCRVIILQSLVKRGSECSSGF